MYTKQITDLGISIKYLMFHLCQKDAQHNKVVLKYRIMFTAHTIANPISISIYLGLQRRPRKIWTNKLLYLNIYNYYSIGI